MASAVHRAVSPSSRPWSAVWRWLRGALVGLGLVCALLTFTVAGLLFLFVLGLVLAACVGAALPSRPEHQVGARPWLARVAAGAAALLAASGMLAAAGGAAFLLWLLVLAGGWVLQGGPLPRAARRLAADAPPEPARPARPAVPVDVTDLPAATVAPGPHVPSLTDDQLCRAWRTSYLTLQGVTDPAALDRLVRARETYLDEMQRRHPVQFATWLGAGARAASDPARYLCAPAAVRRSAPDAGRCEDPPG